MDKKKQVQPKAEKKEGERDAADTPGNDMKQAHIQADRDIADDAELSAHSPNDDLDEGETARLGENNNGLV